MSGPTLATEPVDGRAHRALQGAACGFTAILLLAQVAIARQGLTA